MMWAKKDNQSNKVTLPAMTPAMTTKREGTTNDAITKLTVQKNIR